MDHCWNVDPNNRPTFAEVHKHLDEMCKSKLVSENSNPNSSFNFYDLFVYIELFESWFV